MSAKSAKSKRQKGKAIPIQAFVDPEGSRRLRFPGFSDNRHKKVAK
jgi:hypothetical protein